MRQYFLLMLLMLAACSTNQNRPAAKSAPPAPRPEPWRAVAAKADGAVVPGGRMHSIKRGETGIAIARAYGVSWSRIAAANNLDREATLLVGQMLLIPSESAAAPSAASPASGKRPTPARTASRSSPQPSPRPSPRQPQRELTPEERAAAFDIDIDDLITGSAPAEDAPAKDAVRVATAPKAEPQAAARPAAAATVTATVTTATAPVPRLSWPIEGRVILSRYGPKPGGRFNDGVNIKAIRGQTVRAAADGQVIYVGDAIAGFGLLILVRHPGGTVTAYGHLEAALVNRGDKVDRGQGIARAGSSGSVREPQLLFEVRQGRKAIDPLLYLPR